MKFKLKLLQIKCHVLGFTKDKAQNVLQKRVDLLIRPTPASPSREPSPYRSGSPTDSPRRRRWKKEEDPHLHTDK
jgi:hypothetical protein